MTLMTSAPDGLATTETKRDTAGFQSLHMRLLELTLREEPLDTILEELVQAICAVLGDDMACSVLLADDQGKTLHHGAAVGLPQDYIEAVDGIEIGPCAGTCGTAAYLGKPVHVADISTDPLWQDFRHLAQPLGLKACWSQPILSQTGKTLGTFAIYRGAPGLPSDNDATLLQLVARTTALILDRYAAQDRLMANEHLLETLNRTGAAVAAELDLDKLVQTVTDAGVELTGAQFGAFFYNVEDASGESYMLYTLSGVERSAFAHFPMPRATEIFAPTFKGDGIVRSADITKDPRYGHNSPNKGMPKGHLPVRSYLAVPVTSRSGEVIGGLFFGHPDTDRFSAHHERLMDGIAGQAAIAIDNARLYRAAQREIETRRKTEQDLIETQKDLETAQERVELALSAGAIIGTWIWEIPTDTITADERFAAAFGLDPKKCHDGLPLAEATPSIHPDDRARVEEAIVAAMQQGGEYSAEYRVRHADGDYRWVRASGYCEHDPDGTPQRFPGVLIDIDHTRRTECDLKRREADLALLLDASADGFYAVDTEGRTTRCNASFLRMLGFASADEVVGKKLHDVIHHSHPDGTPYPHEDCPIYRTARTGEMAHVDNEVFFHTDGTSCDVEYWVRPVIWQGELQGAVCNILDISDRKRAEEARHLLLRELNHRVKNLFSITSGMVKMTARNSRTVDEMATALGGRLMSLARAHELITTSISAQQTVAAPATLHDLIETVMSPHTEGAPEALHVSGPEVHIGATATTSLALILHELATNAAKYGALSAPGGRIHISWTQGAETLALTWAESGGPPVTDAPGRDGFGSQLARLSAKGQLGGTIDYDWRPEGVQIRLTAAAERLAGG